MELEKERVGRKQSAEEGGHKKTGADVNWEDKNVVRGRSQDGGSQWNLEKTETRQRREIADKLVTYEELFGMHKKNNNDNGRRQDRHRCRWMSEVKY